MNSLAGGRRRADACLADLPCAAGGAVRSSSSPSEGLDRKDRQFYPRPSPRPPTGISSSCWRARRSGCASASRASRAGTPLGHRGAGRLGQRQGGHRRRLAGRRAFASKGFDATVEKEYRKAKPQANFAGVDRMEQLAASDQALADFRRAGNLRARGTSGEPSGLSPEPRRGAAPRRRRGVHDRRPPGHRRQVGQDGGALADKAAGAGRRAGGRHRRARQGGREDGVEGDAQGFRGPTPQEEYYIGRAVAARSWVSTGRPRTRR